MNDRKGPTQEQMYYAAIRKEGEGNELFMDMIRDGSMTKATLAALLKRRPETWGRFAGFLKTLPN
jgi:hypothetical protein